MEMKAWIFMIILLPFVRGQTVSDVKALRTYLFTTRDYDSNIRPIENQSNPIKSIVKMTAKTQTTMLFSAIVLVLSFGIAICGRCDTAPGTNGCSIPGNLPYFYKKVFTPDCNKHDVCYSCGSYYSVTRLTCDKRFHSNLKHTCRTSSKVKNRIWCRAVSLDYYLAVRVGGGSHYKKTSPSWCSRSWVKQCLN